MTLFISLMSLGLYLYLIFFTAIKVKRDKLFFSFLLYLFSLFLWSLGSLFLLLKLSPGYLFWETFLLYGFTSFIFTFYNFLLEYLKSSKIKIKVWICFITLLFIWYLNSQHLLVKSIYLGSNSRLIYQIGSGAIISLSLIVIYFILCFYEIIKSVNKNKELWKKSKIIFISLCLMVVVLVLNFTKIGQSPINIIMRIINALLISYSIYRFRFLSISVTLKKGIMYTLFAIAVGLSLSFLMNSIVPIQYIGIVATALIVLALFPPIQSKYIHFLNKLALGRMYEIKEIYKDYVNDIGRLLNRNDLTNKLINTLAKAFRIQTGAVYLINKDDNIYQLSNYIMSNSTTPQKVLNIIKHDDFLVKDMKSKKRIMLIDEIYNSESTADPKTKKDSLELLKSASIEVVVPMVKNEELIGFVLISDKKSADPFTRDDLKMINDFVNASLVCLDNSYMYEEIENKAITDDLTGLFNQRYMLEYLNSFINNTENRIISLALVDIDNFKIVNDIQGNHVGDRILKTLSQELKKLPKEYTICRLHGDLFAILMPNTGYTDAYENMDRLRIGIHSNSYELTDHTEMFSVSSGIACYPIDCNNKDKLISHASECLAMAKKNRKNRVISYEIILKKPKLLEKIQVKSKELVMTSIFSLVEAINQRDLYTRQHSENVALYASTLAEYMGFNKREVDRINIAALLHDIGKIGIPESILNKADLLSEDEYLVMKTHVDRAIEILKYIPQLKEVLPAISGHHERYDGKGYPRRLKGNAIPLESHILSISDTFDAMTTDRPYRVGASFEDAIEEIKKYSGRQFDPNVVSMFIKMINEKKGIFASAENNVINIYDVVKGKKMNKKKSVK